MISLRFTTYAPPCVPCTVKGTHATVEQEIKNASCTDNALAAAGASMAERMGPVGAASIDHMTFEQAMDALRMAVRESITLMV